MRSYSISKQKGVTMLFVLVFLFGLFLAIAWATDSGNWLLMKTREQNAIDAIALSAAIALNADPDFSTSVAQTAGRETCELFQQSIGNGGLTDIDCQNTDELKFEFSKYLVDPDTGGWKKDTTPARFVRVESRALIAEPILIQMMGGFEDGQTIYSVATAGAVAQNCNVVPFVMCADMKEPYDPDSTVDCIDEWQKFRIGEQDSVNDYCKVKDDNCDKDDNDGKDDGDGNPECYGYVSGEIYPLQTACFKPNEEAADCLEDELDAGNFNLLDLEGNNGAKDLYNAFMGEEGVSPLQCSSSKLNTKPGITWGQLEKAINDRFDSDIITTIYPYSPDPGTEYPKKNTDGTIIKNAYGEYSTATESISSIPSDKSRWRRRMPAFFGDCRGRQNGDTDLPQVGNACVLLTDYAKNTGTEKSIYTEFIASCPQAGAFSPLLSELLGPFKVVLFKSAGSQDS